MSAARSALVADLAGDPPASAAGGEAANAQAAPSAAPTRPRRTDRRSASEKVKTCVGLALSLLTVPSSLDFSDAGWGWRSRTGPAEPARRVPRSRVGARVEARRQRSAALRPHQDGHGGAWSPDGSRRGATRCAPTRSSSRPQKSPGAPLAAAWAGAVANPGSAGLVVDGHARSLSSIANDTIIGR